jgi:hypothetical protein
MMQRSFEPDKDLAELTSNDGNKFLSPANYSPKIIPEKQTSVDDIQALHKSEDRHASAAESSRAIAMITLKN